MDVGSGKTPATLYVQGKDISGAVLRDALAVPGLWREIGEVARRRVESEFSEKVMIDRHIALYRQILAEG